MKHVVKRVLSAFLVLLVIGAIVRAFAWRVSNSGTKRIPGEIVTEYRDEKFGYRFFYPNDWSFKKASFAPGYAEVAAPEKPSYAIYFFYKDSSTIRTMAELEAFVKDDAAYAEKEQGYKILNFFPDTLGELSGYAYDSVDKDGNIGRSYYVADFTPVAGQQIFVWTVGILSDTGSLDAALADPDVKNILSSFTLID